MNSADTILLQTFDLQRDYASEALTLSVLKGVSLTIHCGEMTFILGRSGSGKSTLLHLMGGLDTPTSGKILFEGEDLTHMKEKELSRIRNRRIGFVFQQFYLLPELTVYENVMLPGLIARKVDHQWIREILRRVKLLSRKDHYPSEISGGEQQRTAIARALTNRPSIVFCDEPTGNLDAESSESIFDLIGELNEQYGQTFLTVTHDEALAWRYEKVYRLVDGILMRDQRGKIDMEQVQ